MGIFSDLVNAFVRTFTQWKLWLALWAVNLLAGLIVGAPLLAPTLAKLGHSLATRGQPFMSPGVFFALPAALGRGGPFLGGSLLVSLFFTAAMQPWLAGGTFSELMSAERFRLSSFLSGCGHLGGRYLRLYVFAAPVFLLMVGGVVLSAVVLEKGHHLTVFTVKPEAWFLDDPFTRASGAQLALALLLLGFWRAYLDLARGLVLQQELRQTRRAAWRAFKLALRSPFLVLFYVLLGLLGWAAVLGMMRVHARLGVTTGLGVLVAFAFAQLVLMVRMAGSVLPTALVASRLLRSPPFAPPRVIKGARKETPHPLPEQHGDNEPSFPGMA